MKFTKPKGTRDILPPESGAWSFVEDVARDIAKEYNACFVRTPTFEQTELFLRTVGDSSDIVNKEMYTFLDKGERSITLRPELTAGIARAVIEQGLLNNVLPIKLCSIGSAFRYENVQAGRYREFTQFGLECFGASGAIADFEAIKMANDFLIRVGVKEPFVLTINSLGCPECRKRYNDALRAYLSKNLKDMCPDCKVRFEKNPLRVLDCKSEECQKLNKDAPKTIDYLCDGCKNDFSQLQQLLKLNEISFKIDTRLVRGLDYYTQTVFEFIVENYAGSGKAITIGGGGRYDKLIEELGGKPTPAVGVGIGLDRIVSLIGEFEPELDVYVANAGGVSTSQVMGIVADVRALRLSCDYNLSERALKQQFKFADKAGARVVLVVGDKELTSKSVTLKDMKSGVEQQIKINELHKFLITKDK